MWRADFGAEYQMQNELAAEHFQGNSVKHKWRQIGESLYECENCGAEVEGYAECVFVCKPAPKPEGKPARKEG